MLPGDSQRNVCPPCYASNHTSTSPAIRSKTTRGRLKAFKYIGYDLSKSAEPKRKKWDGDVEAHLIALSCSKPPKGFTRWSLWLLADMMVEMGYVEYISYETVRKVLKKTN